MLFRVDVDLSLAEHDLELVLDRDCERVGLWVARDADRDSDPSVQLEVLLCRSCGLVLVCGLVLLSSG